VTPVALLSTLLLAAGCKPGTVRPAFPPVQGAVRIEIELKTPQATEILGEILRGDSLPISRVDTRDGLIESEWFRVADKKAVGGRPVGPDVVRIRAWIDPSRSGYSYITLETVYHPVADPSLTSRQLDQQVPSDHPVGKRMLQIATELARLYGDEPEPVDSVAANAVKKTTAE
jgi:hypothetical protein